MDPLAAVVLGIIGVPVGAFLNVVIDRVPDRAPLRGPREGEAATPVQWGPVPAQPWLLRVAGDRRSLPRRWLWVELATVIVLAVIGGRAGDDLSVVPLALLGAALVAVSVIDLQLLRIPDRVTFPTLGLALPLILVVSLDQDGGDAFQAGLIGAGAYFVALLLPHLVYPRGMGFGDVKLALVMGLYLGWLGWEPDHPVAGPIANVLYGLMLGCILGVVFGVGHQVVTRRRGEFPFGPALALGCLVVALW